MIDKDLSQDKATNESKVDYKKELIDICITVVVIIGMVLLINIFVGEQVRVRGTSMENSLHHNDRIIIEKVSYRLNEPKRFDVVVFQPKNTSEDTYYIKRIIGLPGETIQISGNDILINGEKLEENYGKEVILSAGIAHWEIVLGEEEYFVLGDNRNNSTDSRFASVGPISLDSIQGKAFLKVYPFNEIDRINH